MRNWNRRIAKLIMVLLLLHGLVGSFMLLGISSISLKPLAYLLLLLVSIHALLGCILTKGALQAGKSSGHWYLGENAGFWTKRITGVAILILIFFHISAYTTTVNGQFFLKEFTTLRMITQLLFILVIFLHIFVSIKPMLIKQGTLNFKERKVDYFLVLSVFLLVFVTAVVVYYLRWNYGG